MSNNVKDYCFRAWICAIIVWSAVGAVYYGMPVSMPPQAEEATKAGIVIVNAKTEPVKTEPVKLAWRKRSMIVTAYCACPKCCGEYSDGVTASGHKINAGDRFIAADSSYAFGTKIIVPGYNNSEPVEVLDRGGAIQDNRIDVFFDFHEDALKWSVRSVEVQIEEI